MGIKLKWDDQSAQNLDGIEIYRSATKIDSNNPGAPLATIAGSATAYEDNSVLNKSLYYYRILAKKGTDKAWSENILAGYFAETGPGNPTPLRGDWNAGLMDTVLPQDLITNAALRAKVPSLAALSGAAEPGAWYKFCYKGTVFFCPSASIVTASWSQLYSAGLVYGTDDVGVSPSGPTGTVKQRTVVNINGLNYILRLPRMSTLPLNQYVVNQADTLGSEWRDTVARLVADGVDTSPGSRTRLFDLGSFANALGPHLNTNVNVAGVTSTKPETLVAYNSGASVAQTLVLELIMP
ncbi:putative virion structural protein [Erwinia phage phiEaH2]|uniref:Putative virion structural protein n=1 Tax=Erwinia phage phiEaH2 TaxID=1029988 RepID=J7KC86_9CAUD|nr:putative virion structural protein [Erwinia phage phiEaH2]AFQ96616.1 putative virion structural protein [Erwinia phage phiEaH2]